MKRLAQLMKVIIASLTILASFNSDAVEIQLPVEMAAYRLNQLPGSQLVQRNCMTCHSAQYVESQPPNSPRAYWETTVRKMKKPFGAQFPDEDIPDMVDYLVKTYGAERGADPIKSAPKSGTSDLKVRHDVQSILAVNNCTACHAIDKTIVGPAFKDVAGRYAGIADALPKLVKNIKAGGGGKWGNIPMPPFAQLSDEDALVLARYILTQK